MTNSLNALTTLRRWAPWERNRSIAQTKPQGAFDPHPGLCYDSWRDGRAVPEVLCHRRL